MIRHIFMAATKPEVSQEKIDEIVAALNALKPKFPTLRAGKNLGWFDNKTQVVVTGEFENRDAWNAFINSPEHTAIVKNYMDCYNADMIFTSQFELGD